MARSRKAWLVDPPTVAKKVKNIAPLSPTQVQACGVHRQCPNCHHRIDNSDVSYEWPGMPVGVKFNPSDSELLGHLSAKCGVENINPHELIDEFIPTVHEAKGICYTHPKNLPGIKKDGSCAHFFHRTANAYSTGHRKRRKIQSELSSSEEDVRWHKTGKTKRVIENGIPMGYKKIMVLYKKSEKMSKEGKSNWVMHQYHVGLEEDEKDGEFVVSKISYQQQKKTEKNNENMVNEVHDSSSNLALKTSPRTPNPNPPNPPRHGNSVFNDDAFDDNLCLPSAQEKDDMMWFAAGESQADDSWVLCEKNHSELNLTTHLGPDLEKNNSACGVYDLQNIDLDTPPDLHQDLQFASQDSIFDWNDKI